MSFRNITAEMAEPHLDWLTLTETLKAGHDLPKGEVKDVILQNDENTMLSRHAWIDGLGACVKTGMIFPGNITTHGVPNLNGVVTLFNKDTGLLEATMDFGLVTKWKTAGDSLLAARHLARPNSHNILILGAGVVAQSLIEAYSTLFPDAAFRIWNRTHHKAENNASGFRDKDVAAVANLRDAVEQADIISTATMTNEPVLKGAWLQPGQHIDLIGAYLPDMREADDDVMRRARIFVDARDTTVDQIGELIDPIKSGAISRDHILADFYDLNSGGFTRNDPQEITLHKNGGGAHLDLMTSSYILKACP